MPLTKSDLELVLAVAQAIVETVAESPDGAPASALYLAIITSFGDVPYARFEVLMQAIADAGKVRKIGHLYFLTPGARRNG